MNGGEANGFIADQPGVTVRPSPNFGQRRDAAKPSLILLHYTGMESGQAAEDWLCAAESQVSSHYIVHEDARIVQMVPEDARAWHAGASFWRGMTDINSTSIGIEIVNGGHAFGSPPFADVQIQAVIALCESIMERHRIVPAAVVAHSDVAPGRKSDPGEQFPWADLAQGGVALWTEPSPIRGGRFFAQGDQGEPVAALQAMLALYGFDNPADGAFDARTKDQIAAFQSRHRPSQVDGIADQSTIETLHRFLQLLPGLD